MNIVKFLILNLAIFFVQTSNAMELSFIPSIESCAIQAESHGSHINMNPQCFKTILNQSPSNLKISSDNQKILAVGYKNMIYIESKINKEVQSIDKKSSFIMKPRVYTIAGKETTIHEVLSIALNKKSEKIAVLNINEQGQKQILIFPTYRSGDFSPLKVIDLEKIATEPLVISYHEENEEIFILDSKFNQIFVVSSESDSRHHSKDKHPKILRELSFENSSSKRLVSFAIHKEYILLGDKLSNSIYIVDSKCSGKCSIIDSFSDDIFKSCDLKSIQYMDEEFVLTNECQEQNFFKLD